MHATFLIQKLSIVYIEVLFCIITKIKNLNEILVGVLRYK